MTVGGDLRRARGALLLGAVLGGLAPLAGLFAGLAVFPPLGTLLMGPVILLSLLTRTPIGMMSPALFGLGFALSALTGAALVFVIHRAFFRRREDRWH